MNPRHYRVVALGKPTEEQRNQWFLQKYVAHFPTGGEIVLFDRSWYNRAMVEPIFVRQRTVARLRTGSAGGRPPRHTRGGESAA
jgi:polyphosphate kinase 2 (PPK2 family)